MNNITRLTVVAAVAGGVLMGHTEVVGHWTFGNTGFSDSSSQGNALLLGTGTGGVTLGADGQVVFDGTQTSFSTSSALPAMPKGYTVEFFVRMAKPMSAGAILFELSENQNDNFGTSMVAFNVDGLPGNYGLSSTYRTDDGDGYLTKLTDVTAMLDGQWHHVAVVVDPAKAGSADGGVMVTYLDGVEQSKMSHSGRNFAAVLVSHKLYLGARTALATQGQLRFVGELDDVRVSDSPLKPDQFLTVRSARTETQPKVAAHWTFGDKGFADVSGNANGLSATDVGLSEGAAQFGGSSTCHSSSPINFSTAGNGYTVELFVKADPAASDGMLAELSPNYNNALGCFYFYRTQNGGVEVAYRTAEDGSGYNVHVTTAGVLNDGKWHHLALVVNALYAGNPNVAAFYFDGVAQAQGGYTDTRFNMPNNGWTLYLGNRADSSLKFTGCIDNVRITAMPLSPAQFLPSREWGTAAETVYAMNGEDATIEVAGSEVVTYDRIATGCDNANIVLTKSGTGALRVKSPLAGVWNVEAGSVMVPAGCRAPAVKPVAGRKLVLTATTMTAEAGEAGVFTVEAASADALRPRLTDVANVKVVLAGQAQLTLGAATEHGETGLAQGSAVIADLTQGVDAGDFETVAVDPTDKRVRCPETFNGWTPVYAESEDNICVWVAEKTDTVFQNSSATAAKGNQYMVLQCRNVGSGLRNGYVTRTVTIPKTGTYTLNAAISECKGQSGNKFVVSTNGVEVARFDATDGFDYVSTNLSLEAGDVVLKLACDAGTWNGILVDDVTLRGEDGIDLISGLAGDVGSGASGIQLGAGAQIVGQITVPTTGYYLVRLAAQEVGGTVGDYELTVNGKVVSFGNVGTVGSVKVCPVGWLTSGCSVAVSLKSAAYVPGTAVAATKPLTVTALALETPSMAALAKADYASAEFGLYGLSRLWLDYADKLRLKELSVDGEKKVGRLTATGNPEFLSSTGVIHTGRGLSIMLD